MFRRLSKLIMGQDDDMLLLISRGENNTYIYIFCKWLKSQHRQTSKWKPLRNSPNQKKTLASEVANQISILPLWISHDMLWCPISINAGQLSHYIPVYPEIIWNYPVSSPQTKCLIFYLHNFIVVESQIVLWTIRSYNPHKHHKPI